jgi:predicted RNA-binding protein
MCLSTVYELGMGGERKLLAEYVSAVSAAGGTLTFTDIMGSETKVPGMLQSVDLVKNIILVAPRSD